jgi:HicA toxin of bacterial toxin-antitoxin,
MTKRQKAVERLLSRPTDYAWGDFRTLLEGFGYELQTVGGSGRKFVNPNTGSGLFIHEPHPSKILKAYQVKLAIQFLRTEGHIP